MNAYDVIILGAGSAGMKLAERLEDTDLSYVIIHDGFKGTTCARYGCMPSKTFIEVMHKIHGGQYAYDQGWVKEKPQTVNISAIMAHVRALRDEWVNGVCKRVEKLPIIDGAAVFTDHNTLRVNDMDYRADHIVIATGTRPNIPPLFQDYADDILTSENIFECTDLPPSMLVLGLGSIGTELGQTLARLGLNVTAIDPADTIAGLDDEFAQSLKNILERDMRIILGHDVQSVKKSDEQFHITINDETVTCDKIISAAGRSPNLDSLGLKDIGIAYDDKDMPQFDKDTLKIKDAPIYMIGDVNKTRSILHETGDEALMVFAQITGGKKKMRRPAFQIVFTDPQIATIGQQPDEIKEEFITGKASFDRQSRARMMGKNDGMVKIYAAKNDGRILGATCLCPSAENFAHMFMIAVQQNLTVHDMLNMPFYHPTLIEGLKPALKDILAQL